VVWPGLNIQVSICYRILPLLEILRPPSWSLAEGWSRQPASSLVPGCAVLRDDKSEVSDLLLANLGLLPGDFAACLGESASNAFSSPSISPGCRLPGTNHPCFEAKCSLDFLPGKLTNLLLGLPQTR
jgi:hypothetical protein